MTKCEPKFHMAHNSIGSQLYRKMKYLLYNIHEQKLLHINSSIIVRSSICVIIYSQEVIIEWPADVRRLPDDDVYQHYTIYPAVDLASFHLFPLDGRQWSFDCVYGIHNKSPPSDKMWHEGDRNRLDHMTGNKSNIIAHRAARDDNYRNFPCSIYLLRLKCPTRIIIRIFTHGLLSHSLIIVQFCDIRPSVQSCVWREHDRTTTLDQQ